MTGVSPRLRVAFAGARLRCEPRQAASLALNPFTHHPLARMMATASDQKYAMLRPHTATAIHTASDR